MSERSVTFLRRAARRLLSDNREPTVRKRLKGPLWNRERACKRAADIVALTLLNRMGREWGGRSETDSLVFSLRAATTDVRSNADMRITALEKLAVLDGLMSVDTLGTGAQDSYIKSLIVSPTQEMTVAPEQSAMSEEERALATYFEKQGETR